MFEVFKNFFRPYKREYFEDWYRQYTDRGLRGFSDVLIIDLSKNPTLLLDFLFRNSDKFGNPLGYEQKLDALRKVWSLGGLRFFMSLSDKKSFAWVLGPNAEIIGESLRGNRQFMRQFKEAWTNHFDKFVQGCSSNIFYFVKGLGRSFPDFAAILSNDIFALGQGDVVSFAKALVEFGHVKNFASNLSESQVKIFESALGEKRASFLEALGIRKDDFLRSLHSKGRASHVKTVQLKSSRAPLQCSFCHGDLGFADLVKCSFCGTVLHRECLSLNKGCTTIGCKGSLSSFSNISRAQLK